LNERIALQIKQALEQNQERYIGWLTEACSIQSLDGQPEELERMARWVEARFEELGAPVERLKYEDSPDVLLARLGSGERTVLIYDHYDVQPVDPLHLWESKPFEPDVRGGRLFARGAADNKGDLVARLAALDLYRQVKGELPIAIKFLIEGEEETGSRSFEGIVEAHGDKLAADGCIWEGMGIDHAGRPELVFGAKGLAYIEITYRGLAEDQHSSLASYVPSPVWHMIEALSTLRSPDGKVSIDGFYDNVAPVDENDLAMLGRLPFDEDAERDRLGITEFLGGDQGLDLLKRNYFEPTCNVAGIVAGFTVPGTSKTVLPKEVMVKLDLRLVPNQTPDEVTEKLKAHLEKRGFTNFEYKNFSQEKPVRSPTNSTIARAALAAADDVFEQEIAAAPMMTGTGPMYLIGDELGIPVVSPAGVHRPDSNIHAPNENCRIEDFLRIVEYTVAWIDRFATIDG
jgi:acetylornithine deacetylase/succinyl-diaminopimelate desuccinylase-like protein